MYIRTLGGFQFFRRGKRFELECGPAGILAFQASL
jgi:hypothetical protein